MFFQFYNSFPSSPSMEELSLAQYVMINWTYGHSLVSMRRGNRSRVLNSSSLISPSCRLQVRDLRAVHLPAHARLLLPPDLHPAHHHRHELLGLLLARQDQSGVAIPKVRYRYNKDDLSRARRSPPAPGWAPPARWQSLPSALGARPNLR